MSQEVEITLPASTLSVQGTVNGKIYTWINTVGYTWQTVADRAVDDIYVLELQVTSDSGVVSNLQAVLFYSGLNLITDRTAADVARWQELREKGFSSMSDKEKEEWLGDMKGCYGAKDMNRVEGAVALIAGRLTGLGYLFSPAVKMNWTREDVPSKEDMERYFGNVADLRAAIPVYPSTPMAPDIYSGLNYSKANDLEQIILDVSRVITSIPAAWYFAGELTMGEV